jgi:nucleoside-diphosphate-sugar epimerase
VRLVGTGLPLPFASIKNRRSLLFVVNLVDAIVHSLRDRRASGTYVVSDGEDVSTPELIRMIGRALGQRTRLFSCSPKLVALTARALGLGNEIDRLVQDMAVDSSRIRSQLGWQPPVTLRDGIRLSLAGR